MIIRKKLIEVSIPLEEINLASAKEKSIRQGHPSTLHLWWARRPLASAKAMIFSQMVDDPSSHPEIFPSEEEQSKEREKLHKIIKDLVLWENINNKDILNKAHDEIVKSWHLSCKDNPEIKDIFNSNILPEFHDPFAGGGALPLEAQRLGLNSYASDLNPVSVLINKSMIEIPPKFKNSPPVNPSSMQINTSMDTSSVLAQGLAEDVNYYGHLMYEEAKKRLKDFYPKVYVTNEMAIERDDLKKYVGKELKVIAWLWAKTVKSSNPLYSNIHVPLISSFYLSSSEGKEAYIQPVIKPNGYTFKVVIGKPKNVNLIKNGTKLARGANFQCLMSQIPMDQNYIRSEFNNHRDGVKLLTVVLEGDRERVYIDPIEEMETFALSIKSPWKPDQEMTQESSNLVSGRGYGIKYWHEIFTERQLLALSTFSDLMSMIYEQVKKDTEIASELLIDSAFKTNKDLIPIYAESICIYLTCVLSKAADYNSAACSWISGGQTLRNTFGRQAIPMVWDFAEANILSNSTGGFLSSLDQVKKVILNLPTKNEGHVFQADAQTQKISINKIISTDPPYYDNINYADLSDFFYIWMRRSLKPIIPSLFVTLEVPKSEELVATGFRHGGKNNAEKFFLDGMTKAMQQISLQAHPAFPVTIYYAFKQAENNNETGTTNTGWETFLDAVIAAGFSITGTWPIRTEMGTRMVSSGTNALASSIVLVCRKKLVAGENTSRKDFITLLKSEMPVALKKLQQCNIAPVDLAQAALGPGMAIFTRFSKIIDASGEQLTTRDALARINEVLDETLAEAEGNFDSDTRWAITWFEQFAFNEGEYGVAEQLSKSKNTSISGLEEAGILSQGGGKVKLLNYNELEETWDPLTDKRLTIWEILHHLIRVMDRSGEAGAANLYSKLGDKAESSRDLCYRLYNMCEKKKRSAEAILYNSIVQSWPEIQRLSKESEQFNLTPSQTNENLRFERN